MKYLLILLVVAYALAQSTQPVPSCHPNWNGLKDVPVAVNENQLYDIDSFFTGYNLEFKLSSEAPSFATLGEKLEKVATSNDSLHGIKNFHLEQHNNTWGQSFIILTEVNFTSTVKWGKMAAPDALPVIQGEVVVEEGHNVDCFDAIRFNEENVIMVDCAQRSGTNGSYIYKNKFLYINMTTQKVMSNVVQNRLYTDFRHIAHRRFFKYTEDGYHYLIRVYFAQGVDPNNRDNTYMEIFTVNNPLKPYILRVIDRSFLFQSKLSIMDFKIYLGDMYILDYHHGISRFDITPSQQIVITGKYVEPGYLKFGVYSDDLNRQFLLALANHHAVYEIDWTSHSAPRLITKYSLMSGSRVDSVHINNFYVVVQAEANVTNANSSYYTIYNTTWVFTRNSRTYSHAYVAIMHDSFNTLVAFNMQHSIILTMDEEGLDLYRLNFPILGLYPQQGTPLNQEYIFTIIATSTNQVTHQHISCTYTWRAAVVSADNYSLWESGFAPSPVYYANYPGGLQINLMPYVFGPNITYGLEQATVEGQLPEYVILQQNISHFNFSTPMNLSNITFLRQQQYESTDNETMFLYIQDSKFDFFVQQCVSTVLSSHIHCKELFSTRFNHTLLNLTANRYHYYNGQYRHLVAALVKSNVNVVHIHNMDTGEGFNNIHLPPGFSGEVSNIEFLGEFLLITCKHAKTIYVYDMIRCEDHNRCDMPIFTINTETMKHIGVRYFAPLQTYVSDFHPYVMFIQNMDSVIIIDFAATGIRLLQEISSSATKELGYYGWRMAISRDHLVIVNAPDIIEEYYLGRLYERKVIPTRNYPLYNYVIPEVFDLDFSDASDLIYVTAKDRTTGAGKVLVYRSGYPTVMTFYDVFDMGYPYESTLIDATGFFCDFLVMTHGDHLHAFRQFAIPLLMVHDTFSDFTFNITYTNDGNLHRFSQSTVKIANYPVDITINNPKLHDKNFLSGLINYQDDHRYYTISDEDWFNGTVLNYTISCESECGPGGKIVLVDHIHLRQEVFTSYGMYDYHFTIRGGVVQQSQAILRINHNGSVHDYVSMPNEGNGQVCKRVTVDLFNDFFVSACQQANSDVLLYLTTENGYKPFTMGPFISNADAVAKVEVVGNLLFLTDVDEQFHYIQREGGVIVYRINHDATLVDAFEQIEIIDSNDFADTKGWEQDKAFIGGSHVVWTNDTSLYRLLLTEVRHGLFLVDFKWTSGRNELVITKTNFINLREMLGNISMPLPNDAHFAGVTVLDEKYNGLNEFWQIDIVVTIRGFHSFELNLLIDKAGSVLDSQITRIYEKYSYYLSTNYLKSFDGYFAVVQVLPQFLHHLVRYSKQVLAVYDSRPNRTNPQQYHHIDGVPTPIPRTRMMGAIEINDLGDITYDFNFTIRRNQSDPFSNISMVVIDPAGDQIRQVSIHEQLHIITHPGIKKTQHIKLRARNHWSSVQLPFSITLHAGGLAWWAILLIVLACVGTAAVAGYFGWRYWKAKQAAAGDIDTNKSLLERQAQDDQDDDEDDDDEEETKDNAKLEQPSPGSDVVEQVAPATETQIKQEQAKPQIQQSVEQPVVPVPIENPQSRSGTINQSLAQE